MSLVLSGLPPGSQGAVRDVAEAYHTVPLHPLQWHTLVVCLSDSQFAVDTTMCVGFGPSGGLYGMMSSIGADIMHTQGLGPILRWVDDHLFIRIPSVHLADYNHVRSDISDHIHEFGGPITLGGYSWFTGAALPDGQWEEFDEDHSFPLHDLASIHTVPLRTIPSAIPSQTLTTSHLTWASCERHPRTYPSPSPPPSSASSGTSPPTLSTSPTPSTSST